MLLYTPKPGCGGWMVAVKLVGSSVGANWPTGGGGGENILVVWWFEF